MTRGRIPVLESVYVKTKDGIAQVDERTLLGQDGGIVDALDAIDDLWSGALDGRQIYQIDFMLQVTRLLNMRARKQLAEIMVEKFPQDEVTPRWLLAKRSEYARLMVITPPGSCTLIEVSNDLPKVRRHHKYGYRIVPGSTDAMIFGRPMEVDPD